MEFWGHGGVAHFGISEGKGGLKHGSRPWLGMDIFWNCPMQKLCIFMQTKCKKCIVKILMCPRTYFESWIDFVVWVTRKKFSNKANSHRGCCIGFNYTKGTGDNLHIRETWMSSCRVCLLFDRLCWSSAHLHVHVPVIWQWTMKREEDKWLKEFGWLQTRGSGDDLLIICKDCTKAGKKNTFMRRMQNFQRSALVTPYVYAWHRLFYSVYLILSKINHTLVKSWLVNTLM